MYKWPSDLPCSVICGCVVDQLSFTLNSVSMAFDRSLLITIDIEMCLDAGGERWIVTTTENREQLFVLIGRRVCEAALDADGASLLLRFDGPQEASLRIDGSDPAYECYHVQVGGREFHV